MPLKKLAELSSKYCTLVKFTSFNFNGNHTSTEICCLQLWTKDASHKIFPPLIHLCCDKHVDSLLPIGIHKFWAFRFPKY